jgi:hypothetical protein
MPVCKAIAEKDRVYFITFTCSHWLPYLKTAILRMRPMHGSIISLLRNVSLAKLMCAGMDFSAAAGSSLHSHVCSMRPCVNLKTSATNIKLLTGK